MKKFIAILLTAALLLSLLSACNKDNYYVSNKDAKSTAKAEATNESAVENTAKNDNDDTTETAAEATAGNTSSTEETAETTEKASESTVAETTAEPTSNATEASAKSTSESSSGSTSIASSTATSTASSSASATSKASSTASATATSKATETASTATASQGTGITYANNTYTITKGGDYTFDSSTKSGSRIYVNAPDENVKLILSGVTLSSSENSPIFAEDCNKLTIYLTDGTKNTITDSRSEDSDESSDTQGSGAIYADCDTEIEGTGSLTITTTCNNGIHCKKDITIKNATVSVTCPNNALKGNDSVTIKSGTITLISKKGDGIKTTDSDISDKGNQRGTVYISGGTINIYAACDGIDSAYDVNITSTPTINIYTNRNSSYTDSSMYLTVSHSSGGGDGSFSRFGGSSSSSSSSGDISAKGIKADNLVYIDGGTITIKSTDDSIHTNANTTLENGSSSLGNVEIAGGTINLTTSDDAIHGERYLKVSGGTINVLSAYEGLEGNQITISGGTVTVSASDDGLNAAGSILTPMITVSGGTIDITVSSGDTDGIDSNGAYKQTGGFVITRCGASDTSGNSSGLDLDGTCTITGGTLICAGPVAKTPATGSVNWVYYGSSSSGSGFSRGPSRSSSSSVTAGTYSISGTSISFTLSSQYSGLWIASDSLIAGTSYTLSSTSSSFTSKTWTQASGKSTIS